MIEASGGPLSEALTQVSVALWGAGTVLTLISLERRFGKGRLFFWLGMSCLMLGCILGLVADWDNALRAAMSMAALVLCTTWIAVRLLRNKVLAKRRAHLLKEAIEHTRREHGEDD
ncbi:MAG: hypothetical protein JW759_08845 [Candidatus Coatesbacteria bacterium]|nr:hypothetical protein [Candidatus Coatesbacteria bacterium]